MSAPFLSVLCCIKNRFNTFYKLQICKKIIYITVDNLFPLAYNGHEL